MILLLALLVAVLIALPLGGKLSELGHMGLRYGWLTIFALVLQFYTICFPAAKDTVEFQIGGIVLVGSYLLLLVPVWANRGLPGVKIVGVGLLMNLAVIAANGGYMPVAPEALVQAGLENLAPGLEPGARVANTKDIVLVAAETRLWFLADVFVVPRPWPIRMVFSAGDVLIALGAFVLVQAGMGVNPFSRLALPTKAHLTRP